MSACATGEDCKDDDSKRQLFCSFVGLRDDNELIFGDGAEFSVDVEAEIKGKGAPAQDNTPKRVRRFLIRMPKTLKRILEEDAGDVTAVEAEGGVSLELIVSGVELSEDEIPAALESEDDSTSLPLIGGLSAVVAYVAYHLM